MSELLPCPFCGGEAEIHPTYDMDTNEIDGYFVWCDNDKCECKPETREHFTEAEAISAWNTRYDTEYGAVPATEENMAKHGWYRRKTCHDVRTDYKILFECSDCGWSCADTYACDEIAFCPGCGRKVSA